MFKKIKFNLILLMFVAVALTIVMSWHYRIDSYAMTYESQFPEIAGDVDDEDWYWLTHLLTGECHTYSWEHQIAVGSVILNRVADRDYPNTIDGVIKDRKYGTQYACYYDKNFFRTPTQRNWEVAEYLLKYGSQIPHNVIYQAEFKQGSGVWKKIGNTYFCYK